MSLWSGAHLPCVCRCRYADSYSYAAPSSLAGEDSYDGDFDDGAGSYDDEGDWEGRHLRGQGASPAHGFDAGGGGDGHAALGRAAGGAAGRAGGGNTAAAGGKGSGSGTGYVHLDVVLDRWLEGMMLSVSVRASDMPRVTKLTNVVRSSRRTARDCGERCVRVSAWLKPRAELDQLHTTDGAVVRNAVRVRVLGTHVELVDVSCGVPPPFAPPTPPLPPPAPPPIRPPDPWLLPTPPPAPPPCDAACIEARARARVAAAGGGRAHGAHSRHKEGSIPLWLAASSGVVPMVIAMCIAVLIRRRQQAAAARYGGDMHAGVRLQRVPSGPDVDAADDGYYERDLEREIPGRQAAGGDLGAVSVVGRRGGGVARGSAIRYDGRSDAPGGMKAMRRSRRRTLRARTTWQPTTTSLMRARSSPRPRAWDAQRRRPMTNGGARWRRAGTCSTETGHRSWSTWYGRWRRRRPWSAMRRSRKKTQGRRTRS